VVQGSGADALAARAQANTTIKSEATQRVEAFSDIDVNLAGAAAATFGAEGAAGAAANGGAPPAGAARPEGADAGPAPAANGSAANGAPARPGGRRKGPAPMPDAAKEVLTSGEAEKKKRRPPAAAAAGAPPPAPVPPLGAADAAAAAVAAAAVWSEEQEVLLVRHTPALSPRMMGLGLGEQELLWLLLARGVRPYAARVSGGASTVL